MAVVDDAAETDQEAYCTATGQDAELPHFCCKNCSGGVTVLKLKRQLLNIKKAGL